MQRDQWIDLAAWIAELWPHAPVEPETAAAWWPFVAHLEAAAVEHALAELAVEPGRRFPPALGDIIQACQRDRDGRMWLDAWQEVWQAIAGEGGRIRYDGDDDAVAEFLATLAVWREQVDEANPAIRAQFRDHWQARRRQHQQAQRRSLAASALDRSPLDRPPADHHLAAGTPP